MKFYSVEFSIYDCQGKKETFWRTGIIGKKAEPTTIHLFHHQIRHIFKIPVNNTQLLLFDENGDIVDVYFISQYANQKLALVVTEKGQE